MKSVAIYGHGSSGQALARKIELTGECQVACFIDMRAEYWRTHRRRKFIL